jgi:GT2 family glycosyltransferase
MARNPCTPYNFGALRARGEYIALSNPENLHRSAILEEMRDSIKTDLDYVTAAAWCPEQNRWHCHSSMVRSNDNDVGKYLPKGAQYHFMSMMKKSLWDKIGGFDEDYRLGCGYDDPDLVMRLHMAGANFIQRDDLVVEHSRLGAHAVWPPEGFKRNRNLFLSKWA